MKRLLPSVLTLLFLGLITIVVILYGRGYRFDATQKIVKATGALVLTSYPDGASVAIDGKFTTATNNTIQIAPGWYEVKLTKEGYLPWQKKLHVEAEVVSKTDALLFPINPSLSPLTNLEAKQPTISPDGTKIAFVSNSEESTPYAKEPEIEAVFPRVKSGVFILDVSDNLITINRFPRQILDFSSLVNQSLKLPSVASLFWAPDSKQILLKFADGTEYLLDATRQNPNPGPANAQAAVILGNWQREEQLKQTERLLAFPGSLRNVATQSATIIGFSPDETKILYQATAPATLSEAIVPPIIGSNPIQEQRTIAPGKLYVYDLKEDKNFFIMNQETRTITPPKNQALISPTINSTRSTTIQWYPDSKHLILVEKNAIMVMEYDGSNKVSVYAGPFDGSFVAPWPSGGRLIILTSLNTGLNGKSSLYSVNVR